MTEPFVNYRAAAGTRPPFVAWIECGHGTRIDMIPAQHVDAEGRAGWVLYCPPGAFLCVPFDMHLEPCGPTPPGPLSITWAINPDPRHGAVAADPAAPLHTAS